MVNLAYNPLKWYIKFMSHKYTFIRHVNLLDLYLNLAIIGANSVGQAIDPHDALSFKAENSFYDPFDLLLFPALYCFII